MNTDRKSIAQIRQEFENTAEDALETLLEQYQTDERSGVQSVLKRYRKKQEALKQERPASGTNAQL